MKHLQALIGKWHRETFECTSFIDRIEKLRRKLNEESKELAKEMDREFSARINNRLTQQQSLATADELADVAIVLMVSADHFGIDLEDAIKRKFNKIRKRSKEEWAERDAAKEGQHERVSY